MQNPSISHSPVDRLLVLSQLLAVLPDLEQTLEFNVPGPDDQEAFPLLRQRLEVAQPHDFSVLLRPDQLQNQEGSEKHTDQSRRDALPTNEKHKT